MPDEDPPRELEAAVEHFLGAAETAFEEYDDGYADADATLRVLREQVRRLAEASAIEP